MSDQESAPQDAPDDLPLPELSPVPPPAACGPRPSRPIRLTIPDCEPEWKKRLVEESDRRERAIMDPYVLTIEPRQPGLESVTIEAGRRKPTIGEGTQVVVRVPV